MGRLNAALFRKEHRKAGETIRWLKAIPVPVGTANRQSDGVILVEQTIPAAARFLVGSTTEQYESKEFGLIATGTMQISAFPDWARFNHLDRIVLTAPGRLQSSMAKMTRGATNTDALPLPYAQSITAVYVNGVAVDSADYELDANGVKWLGNAPAAGTLYGAEYLYAPRFIVLPQSHRTSPTDKTGQSLPLHYWLDRELT